MSCTFSQECTEYASSDVPADEGRLLLPLGSPLTSGDYAIRFVRSGFHRNRSPCRGPEFSWTSPRL